MTEEEKKAVEWLEFDVSTFEKETRGKTAKTILNLIDKQQKEIEELKAKLEFKEFGDLDNMQFEDTYLDKQVVRDMKAKLKEDEEFYREQNRMYEFVGKMELLNKLLGE